MTTPPVDDPETLRRILSQTEALFLDFDGPVCSVFAGLPASAVVDQLCVVLADGGYGHPPPDNEKSSDPFDVLKYAATLGKTEAEYVNSAFTALEVEAIPTAEPTRDAHDLVRAWSQTGRPVAIVSNNSAVAIRAYVDLHALSPYVSCVSARTSSDPSLLKPSPHLLRQAMIALGVCSEAVVFVGDSTTDVEAARAVHCLSIGYANKPGKADRLTRAGADGITPAMLPLLTCARLV